MKLKDIMKKNVETIGSKDTLLSAHKLMAAVDVRHLLVVDDGTLVGVLSERDVAIHQENIGESIFSSPTDTVSRAMRGDVQTAGPEDEVAGAALRMSSLRIGCLPIIDGEEIIGLVTTTDVLASYPQADEADSH